MSVRHQSSLVILLVQQRSSIEIIDLFHSKAKIVWRHRAVLNGRSVPQGAIPTPGDLPPHDERRPLAWLALHLDRPLMLQDDVLGDGQAEAGAAAVLGAALVDAVEAAEDLLLL